MMMTTPHLLGHPRLRQEKNTEKWAPDWLDPAGLTGRRVRLGKSIRQDPGQELTGLCRIERRPARLRGAHTWGEGKNLGRLGGSWVVENHRSYSKELGPVVQSSAERRWECFLWSVI